jgi:hypothetical protein
MTGTIKSVDQAMNGTVIDELGREIPFRCFGIDERKWIPKVGDPCTFEVVQAGNGLLATNLVPGIRWRSHGSS